jgi:hypothetical protein
MQADARQAYDRAVSETEAAKRKAEGTSATSRKAIVLAAVFLVVIIALTVLAVWFLASNPGRTATIRDIVIVLLAVVLMLTNIAIAAVLLVLVYRLQDLIHVLRNEIVPTLTNVSSTVRTVTGTAKMVSDSVAKPTIRAASMIAGLQQVAKVTRRKVNERRER